MFKAKWLSTDILEEDSTILSQSYKPEQILNVWSVTRMWNAAAKQITKDDKRWKECSYQFFQPLSFVVISVLN